MFKIEIFLTPEEDPPIESKPYRYVVLEWKSHQIRDERIKESPAVRRRSQWFSWGSVGISGFAESPEAAAEEAVRRFRER